MQRVQRAEGLSSPRVSFADSGWVAVLDDGRFAFLSGGQDVTAFGEHGFSLRNSGQWSGNRGQWSVVRQQGSGIRGQGAVVDSFSELVHPSNQRQVARDPG